MWATPQELSKLCASRAACPRHSRAVVDSGSWHHLLSHDLVVGDAMLGCELGAIAGSFDHQLMRGVGQSVERTVAQDGVYRRARAIRPRRGLRSTRNWRVGDAR